MHRTRPVPTLVLAAALAALIVAPASAQRTCGTETPAPGQLEELFDRFGDDAAGLQATCPGTIVVAFHVIHNGATGMLTAAQVASQIAVLNSAFAPHGFQFVLGTTTYTNNAAWFNLNSYANEVAMKAALAQAPAQTMNLYSCIPYGYLGFAYLPWSFPENSFEHGVFIDYRTLPGGVFAPFDLGHTATHEVGHYLGLLHTFDGGCSPPGDLIADTPDEATPTSGCPLGKDTCPTPGVDPIHNYMDYSDDACYSEFTLGQGGRMCQMVNAYKPSLISGGPTPARNEVWGRLKARYR